MSPFMVSSSSLHWGEASYLCPLAEGLLCSLLVLTFAHPCCQGRGLQGSPIRKGQFPRLRQRGLIHGVQVDRSLLFTLTSRQEADSCKKEVSRLRKRLCNPWPLRARGASMSDVGARPARVTVWMDTQESIRNYRERQQEQCGEE